MKPKIIPILALLYFTCAIHACKKKNGITTPTPVQTNTTQIDTYITKTYNFNVLRHKHEPIYTTIHDSVSGKDSTYIVETDTTWWATEMISLKFNTNQVASSRFTPNIAYKTGDHYEGHYVHMASGSSWIVYCYPKLNDSVYMTYDISSYVGPNASNFSDSYEYFSIK